MPPAGMDGPVVASTGIAVAASPGELGPNAGSTVVAGARGAGADCTGGATVDIGVVPLAGNWSPAEDWPGAAGAGIGTTTVLLAGEEISGAAVLLMVIEERVVWAAGIGAMLLIFGVAEVEVIFEHDSDVELMDAGATS